MIGVIGESEVFALAIEFDISLEIDATAVLGYEQFDVVLVGSGSIEFHILSVLKRVVTPLLISPKIWSTG